LGEYVQASYTHAKECLFLFFGMENLVHGKTIVAVFGISRQVRWGKNKSTSGYDWFINAMHVNTQDFRCTSLAFCGTWHIEKKKKRKINKTSYLLGFCILAMLFIVFLKFQC
jgi:hypothetical protein